MSGFNLLHLITKSQPVSLRSCSLPSGARRTTKTWPLSFSQEELRKRLTPLQFHVTQDRGTESAFTGEFTHHKDEGTYTCVVCGTPLFSSKSKFDSGSGWPSFSDLLNGESISVFDDFSHGMHRVETTCSQCGAHLGHLFDDGPRPSRKRYCINSASLAFQAKDHSCSSSLSEGGANSCSSSLSEGGANSCSSSLSEGGANSCPASSTSEGGASRCPSSSLSEGGANSCPASSTSEGGANSCPSSSTSEGGANSDGKIEL